MPGQSTQVHQHVVKSVRRAVAVRLLCSRRIRAALALLALVVAPMLAEPAKAAPVAQTTDWCAVYDLRYQAFGAFIYLGDWVEGVGFSTAGGLLEFDIGNIYTVQATSVSVTFQAPDGAPGVINVDAQTDAFGIQHVGEESDQFSIQPGINPQATISVTAEDSNDYGGNNLGMSVQSSSQVFVTTIVVQGTGVSPFPPGSAYGDSVMPCDWATATPTPSPMPSNTLPPSPTRTPSLTRTPSNTPTITNTPTASNTPTPTFTFTTTYTPSASPTPTPWCQFTDFSTDGVVDFGTRVDGGIEQEFIGGTSYYAAAYVDIPSNVVITWAQTYATDEDANDGFTVRKVNSLGEISGLEDTYVLQGETAGNGYTWDSFSWDVNANDIDQLWVTVQHNTGSHVRVMESFEACGYYTNNPTQTPTATATVTAFPPTETPTASSTALIIASPTTIPYEATTGTPVIDATNTPLPSPTWLPSPTPVTDGTEEDEGERQITNIIADLYTWLVNTANGVFRWFNSIFLWGQGSLRNVGIQIANFWAAILNFLQQLERLGRDILLIVNLLLQILRHLLDIILLWLDQLTNVTRSIISAYQDATPNPVPYLPQCVTAPLESPVCAMWYILQYTIFGGTLGGIILQIILVVVDLAVLFQFVRNVRNLFRTIGEIFK